MASANRCPAWASFIQRHRLDPSRSIYVGTGPQDSGFARRLGFEYRDAADFFARPESHAHDLPITDS